MIYQSWDVVSRRFFSEFLFFYFGLRIPLSAASLLVSTRERNTTVILLGPQIGPSTRGSTMKVGLAQARARGVAVCSACYTDSTVPELELFVARPLVPERG